MWDQLPKPMIFAHRGASAYAPENTLASFELALRQEADGVELDVKLTADGHVVVFHDQTVDRTTNGKGHVAQMTLAELRKLDAGSYFDIAFRGETIPTLEEVIKAVGQLTFINIELSNNTSKFDNLPEKVAAIVSRLKVTHRVMFSSFNPVALYKIHRLLPQTPFGLLAYSGFAGAWARSWLGRLLSYQAVHPDFNDVTPSFVKQVHQHGARVYVWTVDNENDIRRLLGYGVDGIITNDPIVARKVASETVSI